MNDNNEYVYMSTEDSAELASLEAAVPSLSTSAMLVLLNIGVWEGRKLDKSASDDLADDKGVSKKKMVGVYKSLVDSEHLDAIKKVRGQARNHVHYHLTLPWTKGGFQLLTTEAYFKYVKEITALREEFFRLVDEFILNYNFEVAKVQVELGSLFRQEDYPSAEEVRARFYFDVEYCPLPDSGDFRLDIDKQARAELADNYNDFYAKKFQAAMSDVWQRLAEPLENMIERLDYGEDEDKRRFKNTLVDNVLEVVEVMRMANVANDPAMTQIEQDLTNALRGVTPEALREDGYLRRQTRDAAIAALKETKKQIDNLPSIW